VAVALALVAGLTVLLVNVVPMLRSGDGDPREGAASGAPSASESSQPSTSTSQPPSPAATPAATSAASTPNSPSPSPTTPSPKPTPSATTTADDTPTAEQLGQAISSYYGLVPADTDAGWSRLTKAYQSANAGSRNTYERFWGRIDRATVSDAEGDPPDEAEATVTYFFKDGRVVRERTAYGLVNDDGVLKINSSRVISSSTTRG
jgi:hypothetical protein